MLVNLSLNLLQLLLTNELAYASEVSTLNGAPVFSSIVGNSKYTNAANKVQEAFLVQSGISSFVEKVQNEATRTVAKTVDNNTPFKSKDVGFVLGAAYAIGVKKEVTKSFKDPLLPGVTDSVTLNKNGGLLMFKVPF